MFVRRIHVLTRGNTSKAWSIFIQKTLPPRNKLHAKYIARAIKVRNVFLLLNHRFKMQTVTLVVPAPNNNIKNLLNESSY